MTALLIVQWSASPITSVFRSRARNELYSYRTSSTPPLNDERSLKGLWLSTHSRVGKSRFAVHSRCQDRR
ncbi:hypothetical protein ANCCAN_16494, partial [Ancylostoma caninum]